MPPLSPPSPGDIPPNVHPCILTNRDQTSNKDSKPFIRRQTLLDSSAATTNVANNKGYEIRRDEDIEHSKEAAREIALPVYDEGGNRRKGGGSGGNRAHNDEEYPGRPSIGVRCKRKAAGFRLFVLLILLIGLSPLWLAALIVQSLMRLILFPAVKIIEVSMPEFVRLWYIHKVGCLHSKIVGGWRRQHGKRPHSRPIRIDVRSARRTPISIHTIAQFSDNIGYLIVNRLSQNSSPQQRSEAGDIDNPILPAVLIDCGDAKATQAIVESIRHVHYNNQEIEIKAVLTTHHHWDHQGGNALIRKLYPTIETIIGGVGDRVSGCNFFVRDKQRFEIAGLDFESIAVPCHTRGSLVYRLIGENRRDCLFLGDTLFIGGCGACFEGTLKDMQRNFAKILLACQMDSLLFPGHEYTGGFCGGCGYV